MHLSIVLFYIIFIPTRIIYSTHVFIETNNSVAIIKTINVFMKLRRCFTCLHVITTINVLIVNHFKVIYNKDIYRPEQA